MNGTIFRVVAAIAATTCVATAFVAGDKSLGEQSPASVGVAHGGERARSRVHTTIPSIPLATYAGLATDLVLVDVVSSRVIDRPDTLVLTEYELDVIESYFGGLSGRIRVQVAGGVTPTREVVVQGAPELAAGTRLLAFLGGEVQDGALSLLGLDQGCYAVRYGNGEAQVSGLFASPAKELAAFAVEAQEARQSFLMSLEVGK